MVSILFSTQFNSNRCNWVQITTLWRMRAVNSSQIWTHIVKGGALAFVVCIYFECDSSGSLTFLSSEISIMETILETILAWSKVNRNPGEDRNNCSLSNHFCISFAWVYLATPQISTSESEAHPCLKLKPRQCSSMCGVINYPWSLRRRGAIIQ